MSTAKRTFWRDDRPAGSPPPLDPPPPPRYATRVKGRSGGDWKFHHRKSDAMNAIGYHSRQPNNFADEIWWLNDHGSWEFVGRVE